MPPHQPKAFSKKAEKIKGGQGFTLIELLVVISIIGILASLVFAALGPAKLRAKKAASLAQLDQVKAAFEMYIAANGDYPPGPNGRDFCNWCTIPDNNYYATAPGINDPLYLQQFSTDLVTGQPYVWSTVVTQLQQSRLLGPNTSFDKDPWGNPYVYDKNYRLVSGCSGWSPICSMGPNSAIDTLNCQLWPTPPITGGDDICIFLPND